MKVVHSISLKKLILVNTVFAISMAFLESAVVVYLREIAYKGLPLFPLQQVPGHIALTEFFRELATLVMLVTVGLLSSKNNRQAFALFLYNFAVWDIFYYVFLKLLIHWPATLLDWDVLFLIPFIWTGPVLAPIINSLCMIILANIILFFEWSKEKCKIDTAGWILLIIGALGIIGVYVSEYIRFILQYTNPLKLIRNGEFLTLIEKSGSFVPESFPWLWFGFFVLLHLAAFAQIIKQNSKQSWKQS